ncbi:hypothetical protein ACU4HD_47070 [Cupriavidus basilensis]
MRILFIVDPRVEAFETYKDSTFAMMREAAARGYAIYARACSRSITLANSTWSRAVATPIAPTGDEHDWYQRR